MAQLTPGFRHPIESGESSETAHHTINTKKNTQSENIYAKQTISRKIVTLFADADYLMLSPCGL